MSHDGAVAVLAFAALGATACVSMPAPRAHPPAPEPPPRLLERAPNFPDGPPILPVPDATATLAWARYYVPPELHGPLGLTAEGLAARPPAPADDAALVHAAVQERLAEAERCLPVLVAESVPDGVAPVEGWAAFTAGEVAPGEVVVRVGSHAEQRESERCAEEAVARWELPPTRVGGRVWVALRGKGAPGPGPSPEVGLGTRPRPLEPDCVAKNVRVPPPHQGYVTSALVRFAVMRSGEVGGFRVLSPSDLPLDVAEAIRQAVVGCAWAPATDGRGAPVSAWVVVPFRFQ